MESYSLAFESERWMLRKLPTNQEVRRFTNQQQALRESLSLVHPRGATLILTPVRPGGIRKS